MDELSESTHRRTPSFPHAGGQSPRVGGCVGKFYELFDWNLTKRYSSTKRITAERPNQEAFYARRDRSFTERAIATTSKLAPPVDKEKEDVVFSLQTSPTLVHSTPSPASSKSDDTSKRVPGVVARLMGLESLPGTANVSSSKSGSLQVLNSIVTEPPPREPLGPPVLLQELLRQEFQQSKKSLMDKFPAFTKLGAVTQKKNLTAQFEGRVQRNGNSRAPRPLYHIEKRAVSFTPEEGKIITKLERPFIARLQAGAVPLPQPSNSQTSTPSLLSPSMIRGKETVRLLEAAVKALEPNMQPTPRGKRIRESHRETLSESSAVSLRSEKRAFTGSRGESVGNSSSRSLRSPSTSRTWSGKDDRTVRGHESSSPKSRSFRARQESGRSVHTNRTRSTLAPSSSRSASPSLQSHRSRASHTKRVEDPPQALLGTHEASIRGFKTHLSNQIESPSERKLEKVAPDFHPQAVQSEVHLEELPPTPSPNNKRTNVKGDSPEPCNLEQNADVLQADTSQILPNISKTVLEKPSSGGFRSIRLRSRSGKQEKDVGRQGNRIFPSDKHPVEKPVETSPRKEAKVAGTGLSYPMFFSRKHGDKKEGNDKGEALARKRTDSTLMRSLLKRTSESSKRANVEVERIEPVEGVGNQDSPKEPVLSPTRKQYEKTKDGSAFVQARYRSIDDVFPELPMEEKDAGRALPYIGKTNRAVEEKFLGFKSQSDADCQSIERMFGRGFSRALYLENLAPEMSTTSLEEFATESCEVPGTFPNSPSAKYEGSCFSSRNHLNLQEMFEAVSGDRSHDSTAGRRRSFCLSEPRERVSDDEIVGADSVTCSTSAVIAELLEIQRVTVAAHDREDAMTPPALKKFEEELAHGEWTEGAMTPPALKKFEEKLAHAEWSEGAMTPPALKNFEEKLAQSFCESDNSHVPCGDECGQPSPVSVLQSPFLEEVELTTPDESLAELQETDEQLNDIEEKDSSALEDDEEQTQETKEVTATPCILELVLPETIQTEMIEQAILDISRIRNIDARTIGLKAPAVAPAEPQQEQNYIREVLGAANLLREGDAGRCKSGSLFDRIELGSEISSPPRSEILRSKRKLLFDSVNEVMALEPWMRTSSFYVDLPMFPNLHSKSKFRLPMSGEALVAEVYRMICHWRDIAGNVLDDLIDYDMNVPEGRWVNFSHEVADVGLQIERVLLKSMIKEVVDDLTSIFLTRALRTS